MRHISNLIDSLLKLHTQVLLLFFDCTAIGYLVSTFSCLIIVPPATIVFDFFRAPPPHRLFCPPPPVNANIFSIFIVYCCVMMIPPYFIFIFSVHPSDHPLHDQDTSTTPIPDYVFLHPRPPPRPPILANIWLRA